MKWIAAPVLALLMGASAALPPGLSRLLPTGYKVLADARMTAGGRSFVIVALGRADEAALKDSTSGAPARPLMIFEAKGARYVLVARNDAVVLRADEGGQCDPFLDGDATIATKGAYFTVENGVACGQHWSDYITFRYDGHAGGFVFDNERAESWHMNPSNDPDAEPLVRDGPQRVRRAPAGRVVTFREWQRQF
jgi:hypothetical protein